MGQTTIEGCVGSDKQQYDFEYKPILEGAYDGKEC